MSTGNLLIIIQIIGATVNDYCSKLEELFLSDMRQSETSQTMAKKKAWLEKAKETVATLQGERKLQAFFNFTPEVCLNVADLMRRRLTPNTVLRQIKQHSGGQAAAGQVV